MRVLKVVQSYYPFLERGGPAVKVRALAHGLAKRGHQITVVTADLGLAGRRPENLQLEKSRWGWRAQESGVEAFYLPSIGHYRALTVNPALPAFCRASLQRFDIVHFYGLYDLFGPQVSYFCRRRKIPYVIEPMGMYRPIDRSFRLKRLWHATLGKPFIRGATRLIATAELEREDLVEERVPPEKIAVRHNGIDMDFSGPPPHPGEFRAKWSIPPDEPLVTFISRLIPRKNADMLIEAFTKACPQQGRLVIAGPEGERGYLDYLKKHAAANGVASRVVFPGAIYESEKRAMYLDSTVFVLASRYENFANVIAEAVACNVPVVVSNRCGIFSMIEGRAGLVIPPERDALAAALHALLHDDSLYAKLKAGCSAVAAGLTWASLSARMEDIYSDVLSKRGLSSPRSQNRSVSS